MRPNFLILGGGGNLYIREARTSKLFIFRGGGRWGKKLKIKILTPKFIQLDKQIDRMVGRFLKLKVFYSQNKLIVCVNVTKNFIHTDIHTLAKRTHTETHTQKHSHIHKLAKRTHTHTHPHTQTHSLTKIHKHKTKNQFKSLTIHFRNLGKDN